ncbi:hypothetical protein EFN46_06065 [Leuconostoc pseudomesenteroides]|uniref:plasmid pRiA4b ORF-3 family protein n=1 Tax=Leuconostoc pseudomesenteroides TaxID=33968 RepID=UPI0021A988C5|nr:plasmid pRiA4b ORF-3 family protein [Leuconostoc pseudomesenteroides]MCT4387780.1 hypothetical protein [Leuconostoc pseudomesenteroides]
MATHNIYELDVTLKDFEPNITRTLLINGERTLAYLAYTLIASFELTAVTYSNLTNIWILAYQLR